MFFRVLSIIYDSQIIRTIHELRFTIVSHTVNKFNWGGVPVFCEKRDCIFSCDDELQLFIDSIIDE